MKPVLLALLLAVPAGAARRGPNIVVIAVDTLRADRLGCYGYAKPTSPAMDQLAREGVLFERAVSQASWTLPSFASLFTARDAKSHGATSILGTLRGSDTTFVQSLKAAGWRTAAFTAGFYFTSDRGFERGFDYYENRSFRHSVERAVESALDWTRADDSRPFLLFLHTLNVHAPYGAPVPYRHAFDPDYSGMVDRLVLDNYFIFVYNRDWTPEMGPEPSREYAALVDSIRANPRDREHIASHYDEGVARVDSAVGTLLTELDAQGRRDDTVVVLLSDHGEELGERGKFQHNYSVRDAVLRVPLIVRLPGGRGAGRRVASQARLMDLAPTLLDLAGVPAPASFQGTSLRPALENAAARVPAALSFSVSDRLGAPYSLFAVHDGRWMLTRALGSAAALYDLKADSVEERDVSKAAPAEAARLDAALTLWLTTTTAPAPGSPISPSPAQIEQLRRMGYLQEVTAAPW